MSVRLEDSRGAEDRLDRKNIASRRTMVECVLIFLIACLFLFSVMPLSINMYDEGLILTGAMRVAAGQVPHRDFYANYGPGQFYIVAGLFKIFGNSILVERIYDLFIRGLTTAAVYAIALRYCRRRIAVCAAIGTVIWLYALYGTVSYAVVPVSLLNLIAASLVVPLFVRDVSMWRMLGVGCLVGAATLFRYDTGIGLLGVEVCVIAIACCVRRKTNRLQTITLTFGACLLGFAIVTLPALIYYLSVAPFHDFVHDIIWYPVKYYNRARGVPFPGIRLKDLDNFEIYLLIALEGLSAYAAIVSYLRARVEHVTSPQKDGSEEQNWVGFFVTFGLLVLVMYLKAYVRIGVPSLYLAIIPSVLLFAGLFKRRLIFPRQVQFSILLLIGLSLFSAAWGCLRVSAHWYSNRSVVQRNVVRFGQGRSSEIQTTWCKTSNVLTQGLCFRPEDDRIQTIEFIDSHTTTDQKLFSGLPAHDKIFNNDNLIYFATQRLPATKWSHFDPDLQDRYDIQAEMVRELETTAPPYIVLESELNTVPEPNDSSRSSGVTLLDDYIHSKYQHVKTYGTLAIWQRTSVQ